MIHKKPKYQDHFQSEGKHKKGLTTSPQAPTNTKSESMKPTETIIFKQMAQRAQNLPVFPEDAINSLTTSSTGYVLLSLYDIFNC